VDVLTLPALPSGSNTIGAVKLTDGTTVATVRELGANDALNVAMVDGSGNQITSFGGGTQYTEGDVDATITGTAAMAENGSNTLVPLKVDAQGHLQVHVGVESINLTDNVSNTANVMTDDSNNLVSMPSFGYAFDGSTWDRMRGDSTDGLLVNLGANNDVVVSQNDLTQTAALTTGTLTDTLTIGNGIASVSLKVSGTWSGTLSFEATVDNATWDPVYGMRTGVGIPYTSITESLNDNIFRFTMAGMQKIRVTFTRTSGTADIAWRASYNVAGVFLNFPIPPGTNNIGDVDILTIAAGDNNIGNVDIVTMPTVTINNPVIATGTNVIGKVGIDQTTPGTTNGVALQQIGATTVATGNGVVGTGVQRVAIASDNSAIQVIEASASATKTAVELIDDMIAAQGASLGAVKVVHAGAVALTSAPSYANSTINPLNMTTGGALRTSVMDSLPAGTNAIGKLAANSGVDIGDVDITSVVPGTAATNLGKAEDAAHTTGDTGVMMLGVRTDTVGALAGTSGDYNPIQLDGNGNVTTAPQGCLNSLGDLVSEAISNTDGASTAFTNFGATASIRNYVTAIHAFRTDAGTTPIYVDFRDGTAGSVLYRVVVPAGGGVVLANAGSPLFRTSANTALAYDASAATTTLYINISGMRKA
jgi:hypothetical protein